MTSNHVPLFSAYKKTFKMTLRMTFRAWYFRGYLRRTLKETLRGTSRGLQEGVSGRLRKGLGRGLAVVSSSGQLRSISGLVQVWFSLELKFNSFELDSEVGRLVSSPLYPLKD